jgi:hypothetical protein
MVKLKITDEEFDRQYEAAVKRGQEKVRTEPQAKSVSYDRDTNELVIYLKNGVKFAVPCHLLREFDGADPNDIAAVELRPRGAALHWEKLDQDMTVAGLIASGLGSQVLMAELGRKGGTASSEAKAAAARENGRKGGRPAKTKIVHLESIEASLGRFGLAVLPLAGATQVVVNGLPIPTEEFIKIQNDLRAAYAVALEKGGHVVSPTGLLMNHPEPIVPTEQFALWQSGDAWVRSCLTSRQEAANSAELALAA